MERASMYRFMVTLSMKLGLRPIELAHLETSWFIGQELRIPHGKSKRGKARTLPVDEAILGQLQNLMTGRQGRVFRNAAGDVFDANGISMAMRRLFKQAGVKGSCYSGRRTAATNMVDKGVNIRIIQEFLGHTSLATTASYCGVTPKMLRDAVFS
jgi:integrase